MSKQSDRERERLLEFIELKVHSRITEDQWRELYPEVAARQAKARSRRNEEARRARYWREGRNVYGLLPEETTLAHRLIDFGYKTLAKQLHPDLGGTAQEMARLNRARDELRNKCGVTRLSTEGKRTR